MSQYSDGETDWWWIIKKGLFFTLLRSNAAGEVTPVNGGAAMPGDMEAFKQEILAEMRKEMAKMKMEIIDGIYIAIIEYGE